MPINVSTTDASVIVLNISGKLQYLAFPVKCKKKHPPIFSSGQKLSVFVVAGRKCGEKGVSLSIL
jgi:hypothetical protein